MTDAWMLLGVLAAGMVLGLVFFGGLWWTLRQGLASAHPARWFVLSLLVLRGYSLSSDELARLRAAAPR